MMSDLTNQTEDQLRETMAIGDAARNEINRRLMVRGDEIDARRKATLAGRDKFTDDELVYSAGSRCPCGAGIAYPKGVGIQGHWDCADILTGRAIHKDQPGAKTHDGALPFAFYEVKSENQPSANGATTRPKP